MAQVTTHHPDLLPGPPDGGVVRVPPQRLPEAVARLLGTTPESQPVKRFIDAAEREGTDLSLLWGLPALRPGEHPYDEVCLVVPGTGRTGMVFLSTGDDEGPAERPRQTARGRLVERVCAFLRAGVDGQGAISPHAQDLVLAQTLLEPDDRTVALGFIAGGFIRLAELEYLKRDLPRRAPAEEPIWPAGVSVRSLSEFGMAEGDRLLATAMERSYEHTLDCPALCGMRDVRDVLESHRAVGVFDPKLWYLVMSGHRAEGCMLLSAVPASESVELVYLGLGPSLRGKGVGRGLLTLAIARLAGRRERSLACAVDAQNGPALTLYRAMKFRRFALRTALVCPLRDIHRGRVG